METAMLRTIFIAPLMLIACALGATASAHPKLLTTEPAAGAVVTNSPKEVRIKFSEDLVLKFSGAEVKDKRGRKVAIGAPVVDPANKKLLVMPVPTPLPAGVYSVDWHAVASDTHRIKGSYTFTVEPK
jgi:methionine-rich copper-binding protein CopC